MTNGQRTVAGMLAVVAVMLGLNLFARRSVAQAEQDGACCLPNGDCVFANATQCQGLNGTFHGEGVLCASVNCNPVVPMVVGGVVHSEGGLLRRTYRFWNDGSVDMSIVTLDGANICTFERPCGPVTIIPGSCMADVDRDGQVAVPDLLTMLGAWGACQ